MTIKKFLSLIIAAIFIVLLPITAFADTYSLYGNLDDSSGTVNLLIDIYQNDFQYDPFNEYVVFRTSAYDYYLYFGRDLSGNDLTYYHYVTSYNQQPANISRGSATSLSLNTNGYYYVGNVSGSLASMQFTNYRTMAVVVIAIIAILIFMLFRIFRKSSGMQTKFYKVG